MIQLSQVDTPSSQKTSVPQNIMILQWFIFWGSRGYLQYVLWSLMQKKHYIMLSHYTNHCL